MSEGVERLVLAIRDLWTLQRSRRHDGDGAHGLTGMTLLHLLRVHGPTRVSDLAAAARIDTSVASRQVSALERRGLVQKVTDPADGRSHLVQLTGTGVRTHEALRAEQVGQVSAALAGWSAEEIDGLATALERLRSDLVASGLFKFAAGAGAPNRMTKETV